MQIGYPFGYRSKRRFSVGGTVPAQITDLGLAGTEALIQAGFSTNWAGATDLGNATHQTVCANVDELLAAWNAARASSLSHKRRIICDWDGISSLAAGENNVLTLSGVANNPGLWLDAGGWVRIEAAAGKRPAIGNRITMTGARGVEFIDVDLAGKYSGTGAAETQRCLLLSMTPTFPARPVIRLTRTGFGRKFRDQNAPDADFIGHLATGGNVADQITLDRCSLWGGENCISVVSKTFTADYCDIAEPKQDYAGFFGHTFESGYFAYIRFRNCTWRESLNGVAYRSNHKDLGQTGTSEDIHFGYRVLILDSYGHAEHYYAGDAGQGGGTQGNYNDDHLNANNLFVIRRSLMNVSSPAGFRYFSPQASHRSYVDRSTFMRCGRVPSSFPGDVNPPQDMAVGILSDYLPPTSEGVALTVIDSIYGLITADPKTEIINSIKVDPRIVPAVDALTPEAVFNGANFSRGGAPANNIANKFGYTLPNEGTQQGMIADIAANFTTQGSYASIGAPAPNPVNYTATTPPVAHLITGVEIMGNIQVASTVNKAPVSVGDLVTLPTNGWVVKVTLSQAQAIDPTKLLVSIGRPGSNAGAAHTWADLAYGEAQLRRPVPDQAQIIPAGGTSYYIIIDSAIHQQDIVTNVSFGAGFYPGSPAISISSGIVRNDTLAVPKPIVGIVTRPLQRISSLAQTMEVEISGVSDFARALREFDQVEVWCRSGGVDGPIAIANTMVRSLETPAAGRNPSGLAAPVFRATVQFTGLADGLAGIRYRVRPFVGPAWESWVDGAVWPTPNPEQEMPVIIDAAGKFSPVYAWVNQDGIAGASPAVQTASDADPGQAASFANFGTARAAIAAFNNARGGGLSHNDSDGGIIQLRDVAGSVRGSNAGAYSIRAATIGGVIFPLEVRAASGGTSQLCRLRGVLPDGSASPSKSATLRILWRNITFDSEGTATGADNIIVDGSTGHQVTKAANLSHCYLVDCDVFEKDGAGTANAALYRVGWRHDYRVDQLNPTGNSSLANAGSYATHYQCMVRTAGSRYTGTTAIRVAQFPAAFGVRLVNVTTVTQGRITIADGGEAIDRYLFVGFRIDASLNTSGILVLGNNARNLSNGIGMLNVFVRQVGAVSQPAIRISGDGDTSSVGNWIGHHVSSDGGLDAGEAQTGPGRWNIQYNDQTYSMVEKIARLHGCVAPSMNCKTDTFLAPENPQDNSFTVGTRYTTHEIVHDGNAVLANRLWYVALQPSTAVAGDLANGAIWKLVGAINGTTHGQNPIRTGNWRLRNMVNCIGNVIANSATDQTAFGPDGFLVERAGRNGALAKNYSDYYKNPLGGAAGAINDNGGDYRPKSVASGDGLNSPLLDRIPAGRAVCPIDIAGSSRLNDGTGAAGPWERAA